MNDMQITGAGITGPAAALVLAKAGHQVTVNERRPAAEIRSHGVIGVTPQNKAKLLELGADVTQVELDNSYTDWNGGNIVTKKWDGAYVMWSDLHELIVDAARQAGVTFDFESNPQQWYESDVIATGLGFAASRGLGFQYTGSVVYRGLSSLDTDFAWLAVNDPEKRFAFKLAHTPIGASWEMYVKRPQPEMRTVTGIALPPETALLPAEFLPVVNATRELAVAPMSDWDQASMVSGSGKFTIGDANGGVHPHTGMGANLGLLEAFALPEVIADPDSPVVAERQNARRFQHDRGIRIRHELIGEDTA